MRNVQNLPSNSSTKRLKSRKKFKEILTNNEKKLLAGAPLKREITTACDGLVLVSEIDSGLEPVFVKKSEIAPGGEFHFLAQRATGDIAERPADEFFARLVLDREWHGEREKAMVRRYRVLKEVLYSNLTQLRQYRSGRVKVKIYVVGYDNEGNLAGITAETVET